MTRALLVGLRVARAVGFLVARAVGRAVATTAYTHRTLVLTVIVMSDHRGVTGGAILGKKTREIVHTHGAVDLFTQVIELRVRAIRALINRSNHLQGVTMLPPAAGGSVSSSPASSPSEKKATKGPYCTHTGVEHCGENAPGNVLSSTRRCASSWRERTTPLVVHCTLSGDV